MVYRHLKRFADDGWRIFIVADWGQDALWPFSLSQAWRVATLSHRRFFWPPFKQNSRLSRTLRAWLWGGEVRRLLGQSSRVGGALTYLSGFSDTLSIAAAGFAGRYGLPLATIVHDDARCFQPSADAAVAAHARRQWVVERSHKTWFASPELAACFRLPATDAGVLPPIPQGTFEHPAPQHRDGSSSIAKPLLIYAGFYWRQQISLLGKLARTAISAGGQLLAVVDQRVEYADEFSRLGVETRSPFEVNADALDYFRSQATAMVVSYCEDSGDMPWTRTSFPSKLIEYSHLHLPLVIVASADTAVVRWARRSGFPDVFEPGDVEGFARYVDRLKEPDFRESRSKISLALSHGEFCPRRIHDALASTFD